MNSDIWEKLCVGLLGIIIGGLPSYFNNHFKPSKPEVIDMISTRTPSIITEVITSVKDKINDIHIKLAILDERIDQLTEIIKKYEKNTRKES